MNQTTIQIPVMIYPSEETLDASDFKLLQAARAATENAYAPYSNFRVGVALRMLNGETVTGSNQENASFPAGLCAERVALSAASAAFPGMAVTGMALTYDAGGHGGGQPISPCGICRQTLAEYEQRFGTAIRLILGGQSGEVFILQRATDLLPFAFSSKALTR